MKIEIVSNEKRYNLKSGQAYLTQLDGKVALWYCCHVCNEEILVADHQIIQNPDGTITVTPSLVCPTEGCSGHYFITNSEIC